MVKSVAAIMFVASVSVMTAFALSSPGWFALHPPGPAEVHSITPTRGNSSGLCVDPANGDIWDIIDNGNLIHLSDTGSVLRVVKIAWPSTGVPEPSAGGMEAVAIHAPGQFSILAEGASQNGVFQPPRIARFSLGPAQTTVAYADLDIHRLSEIDRNCESMDFDVTTGAYVILPEKFRIGTPGMWRHEWATETTTVAWNYAGTAVNPTTSDCKLVTWPSGGQSLFLLRGSSDPAQRTIEQRDATTGVVENSVLHDATAVPEGLAFAPGMLKMYVAQEAKVGNFIRWELAP